MRRERGGPGPGRRGRPGADDAEEYARAFEQLSAIVTDIVVLRTFQDGGDVLTWFELHTSVAEPLPVANWSRVADGRITRVRVTSNAAPLTAPAAR